VARVAAREPGAPCEALAGDETADSASAVPCHPAGRTSRH
jgi:hypothetical protein